MKYSFLLLALIVACSKPIGNSKKSALAPDRSVDPITPTEEITDPLVVPDQQQQTDEDFNLNRTYNGANVVLNYSSSSHLGMIRVKGKDAEKLNKYMALNPIKIDAQVVKNELEAKVGKHVMCRPDACWIYIDYKNGDVKENTRVSETAKASRIILTYKGDNVELNMLGRKGRIFFEGMDAKALYSVMAVPELEAGGKGSISSSKKSGNGVDCTKVSAQKADEKDSYKCEVKFNHRTGAMKDNQE